MKVSNFHPIEGKVIYIPDNWDTKEENGKEGLTYEDFIELTEGDHDVAQLIFDLCEWEYPSTVLERLLMEGDLKYHKGKYKIKAE